MNIFYISQVDLRKQYSGSVHVKEVVNEFAGLGNKVVLFAQKSDGFELNNNNVSVKAIGMISRGFLSYLIYQFKLIFIALFFCFREKPDILYVRSEAAMFAHILISKIWGVPYFIELNSWPFRDFDNVRDVSKSVKALVTYAMGISIRKSLGIICVTEEIASMVKEKYNRTNGVYAVENGVNTGLFKPKDKDAARKKYGFKKNDFILGFVAYYQYYNDAELAIRALNALRNKIPEAKLLLVGGWAQAEHLTQIKELSAEIENSSVVISGEVPYLDVPEYIACCDISLALFNTYTVDGSAMKVYEYLACAKACIGSDIASLGFLEKEGVGVTVPVGDIDTLISKILEMKSKPREIDGLGQRGYEYVKNYRTWKAVTEEINRYILLSVQ